MSVTGDLRTVLVDRLDGLSTVQKVYDYRELNPDGWPCVWVLPADLDGVFVSTTENKRVIGFTIMVLFPLGEDFIKDGSINRERYAENTIGGVLDQIINDLDTNSFLNSFADITDANTTFINAEAADAQWGEVDMQHGKAKACQITLLMRLDYQVRS